MKNRIFAAFLALLLLFLAFPAVEMPASAAENIKVKTAEELRQALMKDGDVDITLTADIKEYKLPSDFKWAYYDESTDFYFWANLGKGRKTLGLNGHVVNIDDDFVTTARYVNETKYNVETGKYYEALSLISDNFIQNAAMIRVSDGSTLIINGYGGGFTMTAQIPAREQMRDNRIVMQRDVFRVDGGTLTVQGGTYQAGRKKEMYVSRSQKLDSSWRTEWSSDEIGDGGIVQYYYGYGEYAINGVALKIYGGSATVNGGRFIGHGYSYIKSNNKVYRNSALMVYDGKLTVHDINVTAYCGADALFISSVGRALIYAGEFNTKAPDRFLWPIRDADRYEAAESRMKSVDVKPGSVKLDGADLRENSEFAESGNRSTVSPKLSGVTGGVLKWTDGTESEGAYTVGSSEYIVFEPAETYFPENTVIGGQKVEYYYSVMVQKTDGKWVSANENSWVKSDSPADLAKLNDNWADGRRYSVGVKTVEYWHSDSHTYEITTRTAKRLYFTADNNKVITKVTIDGFSQEPKTVGPKTLTSKTTGVASVSSLWYENGKAYNSNISVTAGTYQACVTVTAADGYVFTNDTAVSIYGLNCKINYISTDGKTIQVDSPVINKPCDHSKSRSDWQYDSESHYKYCSVCGALEKTEPHKYANGESHGTETVYSCIVCDYEKTVNNGREAINALLLDMPALKVGETLTVPVFAQDFKNKAVMNSYQWYKGRGTTEKVAAGTVLEEGWYTLEVSAGARNGYYFKSNAFITHAHGTKAGATVKDTLLVGTVYVYCSEEATALITIPALTPDRNFGQIIRGTTVSRSGDTRINVNFYVKEGGSSHTVARTFDGKYSLTAGSGTLDSFFATEIQPNSVYEINIEFSVGKYYVDPYEITVESDSLILGYTSESNDAWASANVTLVSDTDVIERVDLYKVVMPKVGEKPNGVCLSDDARIIVSDSHWNEKGTFTCGKEYTFSASILSDQYYRVSPYAIATVNGYAATLKQQGGSTVITFTAPALAHDYGEWETLKEPDCANDGLMRRVCRGCGHTDESPISAYGHDLYTVPATASTCVDHGVAEHFVCSACGKVFDSNGIDVNETNLELPLDSRNHVGGPLDCDEKEHYVLCACGEKLERGAHSYGEWVTVFEPLPGVKGIKERYCDDCGYTETEEIAALAGEHEHSFVVRYNEKSHWEGCVCGEKKNVEDHSFGEDGVCTVCGYSEGGELVGDFSSAPIDNSQNESPNHQSGVGEDIGKSGSLVWLWILIALIVIAVIVAVIIIIKKKSKQAK